MSSYRRHFQHDILRINTVLLTSLSLALSTPVPLLNTTPIEGVRERAEDAESREATSSPSSQRPWEAGPRRRPSEVGVCL